MSVSKKLYSKAIASQAKRLNSAMNKTETLEESYKKKFDWMPENIKNEIVYFNLFRLGPSISLDFTPLIQPSPSPQTPPNQTPSQYGYAAGQESAW